MKAGNSGGRLGKWSDVEEVRGLVEGWSEEVRRRFDSRLVDRAAAFVNRQMGLWEHWRWEEFIGALKAEGYSLPQEMRDHVGLLLERLKELYHNGGFEAVMEKALQETDAEEAAEAQESPARTATKKSGRRAKGAADKDARP